MIRRLLFVLVPAVLLSGCNLTPPWDSAPFVHAVYFKFKSGPSEAASGEMLTDIKELLEPIPAVKGLWAGRPAPTTDMPFVDASYDVGLLITFGDQKGLREYASHPRHGDFVKKYGSKCDVRVFDFSPAGDMKP